MAFPPTFTGGPCTFTVTNMPQGDAVCTFKAEGGKPIWEVVYNGKTYKTGAVTDCGGTINPFISGGSGQIQFSGEKCNELCCQPGSLLRVVEYGEATVNFLADEIYSGWDIRPGGTICPSDFFCGGCPKCTNIRETWTRYIGFQSFNGSYPAKLIDGNTGQEVPAQDLADALAMDLTQLANCSPYFSWRWEFYAVDQPIGRTNQPDGGDAFIDCDDPNCADVPLVPPVMNSPIYRVNLVAPGYGYRDDPSPRHISSGGASPATPCPTPKDFIGGQPGCFAQWEELFCQEPIPPQRDNVSSTGEWQSTAVPFLKCIDDQEPPLGATNYYTGTNMEAIRRNFGAWAQDCCDCDAEWFTDYLEEMLTATLSQNWIYTDHPIPCT